MLRTKYPERLRHHFGMHYGLNRLSSARRVIVFFIKWWIRKSVLQLWGPSCVQYLQLWKRCNSRYVLCDGISASHSFAVPPSRERQSASWQGCRNCMGNASCRPFNGAFVKELFWNRQSLDAVFLNGSVNSRLRFTFWRKGPSRLVTLLSNRSGVLWTVLLSTNLILSGFLKSSAASTRAAVC